ncbi:MAG: phosphoglycerate kinase [Candidatus Methanomethylicota archaeon]|nr:MAG: phosphoglycerate kinase [Candidatus Verstraetearchaeota archaeon]
MPHDYYHETRDYWLVNLASQLKSPTLMRIDINIPVVDGRIVEDNMRLIAYSHVLELLSDYTGLIVTAHQGRPGEPSFINLKQHWISLRKLLPSKIDIEFIPKNRVFTDETKRRIKELKENEILLLDNVRMFDEEYNFNPERSSYISFFKEIVKSCVNDAIPVWHRAHTSLMALPYIAQTWIGVRSIYELKALSEVQNVSNDCAIIMGGSKLQKTSYLVKILSKMEGFTGGLPGQLIARVKGFDLGPRNNAFLNSKMSKKDFEAAKMLVNKFNIHHPIDFVVLEDGDVREVPIEEMYRCNGIIMDIGMNTVELYAEKLQQKLFRIRAGPLGVYEKGFANGIVLTKMIAGSGLIFLGGDTTTEIVRYGLDKIILSTGGVMCISGGAFLHGLAGESYPSVDLILRQKNINP